MTKPKSALRCTPPTPAEVDTQLAAIDAEHQQAAKRTVALQADLLAWLSGRDEPAGFVIEALARTLADCIAGGALDDGHRQHRVERAMACFLAEYGAAIEWRQS